MFLKIEQAKCLFKLWDLLFFLDYHIVSFFDEIWVITLLLTTCLQSKVSLNFSQNGCVVKLMLAFKSQDKLFVYLLLGHFSVGYCYFFCFFLRHRSLFLRNSKFFEFLFQFLLLLGFGDNFFLNQGLSQWINQGC